MMVTAEICIFTNDRITVEVVTAEPGEESGDPVAAEDMD